MLNNECSFSRLFLFFYFYYSSGGKEVTQQKFNKDLQKWNSRTEWKLSKSKLRCDIKYIFGNVSNECTVQTTIVKATTSFS